MQFWQQQNVYVDWHNSCLPAGVDPLEQNKSCPTEKLHNASGQPAILLYTIIGACVPATRQALQVIDGSMSASGTASKLPMDNSDPQGVPGGGAAELL